MQIIRKRVSISGVCAIAGALAVVLSAMGCATELEDGYKPHGLDATPEMRRAYYASPFTDQANATNDRDSGPRMSPSVGR